MFSLCPISAWSIFQNYWALEMKSANEKKKKKNATLIMALQMSEE